MKPHRPSFIDRESQRRWEAQARSSLYPPSGGVIVAPLDCPVNDARAQASEAQGARGELMFDRAQSTG